MEKYIALLRGINVSGQKMIKMAELKEIFRQLDGKNINTYIQSGNIIFNHPLSDTELIKNEIENSIKKHYQFEVPAMVINKKEWQNIIEKNPFIGNFNYHVNHLHITFIDQIPTPEMVTRIASKNMGIDKFILIEKAIYLYCPNGYGKTKLTNTFFEQQLKTNCTTRNWKTILALENY